MISNDVRKYPKKSVTGVAITRVYHQISFVKQPNQIPQYKKKTYGPPTFKNPIPTSNQQKDTDFLHMDPTTWLNRQPSSPQDFPKQSQAMNR